MAGERAGLPPVCKGGILQKKRIAPKMRMWIGHARASLGIRAEGVWFWTVESGGRRDINYNFLLTKPVGGKGVN